MVGIKSVYKYQTRWWIDGSRLQLGCGRVSYRQEPITARHTVDSAYCGHRFLLTANSPAAV